MAEFTIDTSKVVAAMRAKSLQGRKTLSVKVGYSAPYAVYVHEDLNANHPNGGQAKYLSTPSRDPNIRRQMRAAVKAKLLAKRSLEEGVIDAGNILLAASIPLVPVDTGFLVDSAWVDKAGGRVRVGRSVQKPAVTTAVPAQGAAP